jgi:hypothetical protein
VVLKENGREKVFSKLSFIDLAGSERAKDVIDQNKQTRYVPYLFLLYT